MKKIEMIVLWSLLAIALQVLGYYYLDQVYLTAETRYQEIKVSNEKKEVSNQVQVKIPGGSEKISLSSDGKYVAYSENAVIKVLDTENDSFNYLILEGEISYYKWLPDRDIMIVAEKYSQEGNQVLRFLSYDAQRDRESKLLDGSGEILKIPLPNAEAGIADITLSPLTHIMYVKVTSDDQKSHVYSINVMNQLKRLKTASDAIGNIFIPPHGTRLIYEELETERIMVSGSDNLQIDSAEKLALLGVDSEDRIYLGKLEDNQVTQIFYGNLDTPTEFWPTIRLPQSVTKEAIQLTKDGQIYLNDFSKRVIFNVRSGKETAYQGEFIQLYDTGIAALVNGKLVKTPFE